MLNLDPTPLAADWMRVVAFNAEFGPINTLDEFIDKMGISRSSALRPQLAQYASMAWLHLLPYPVQQAIKEAARVSKAVPMFGPSVLIKGDYVGHPFRGNQWTDSSGVSRSGQGSGARPSDKTLRTIAFEMDSKMEVLKDEGARLVKFAGGIEFVDRQAYIDQLPLVSRATPNHQVIASGVTMTEEALNDEADVAVIEDRDGQVCGAISMSSKPYTSQELSEFLGGVDPNSTWIEMRSAGSTMKVDGVGSGLFAAAISKAAESGSGLYLSPLDESARQFWASKGFREAERVGGSEGTYQYLDAESVRIIANNLEEGWGA